MSSTRDRVCCSLLAIAVTPADPFPPSGSQGILQRPSKQELETVFGTHNDTEIVEQILTKGKFVTGKAIDSLGQSNKNTLVPSRYPSPKLPLTLNFLHSSGQQTSRGSVSGGR